MKRFVKYVVLAVLVLAVLVGACACSKNNGVTRPEPAEGAKTYEVTGEVTIKKLDEQTLRVYCETNIMKETILVFSIDSYEGEQLEKKVLTMPELADGKCIYADFNIDPKWEGPITAAVSVTPSEDGKQVDAVKEAYGSKLENVMGEDVLFNSKGNIICFQSDKFTDY